MTLINTMIMATITDAHMDEVVLRGGGGGPDDITRCPLVVDSTLTGG